MGSRLSRSVAVLAAVLVSGLTLTPAQAQEPSPPPASKRTMPTLKVECPAKIGPMFWAGIMPDGPIQESCHYVDGFDMVVGAGWGDEPLDPSDERAACPSATDAQWKATSGSQAERRSSTHRVKVWLSLDQRDDRQLELVPQLKALADKMLAAAEKVAEPCYPAGGATPTPSAEESSEPEPSPSEEPSPTPSPSASPACETVTGQFTDNNGKAVPGVIVTLTTKDSGAVETATDAAGRFELDPPAGASPDDARLEVTVRDAAGAWQVYAGAEKASLVTEPFSIDRSRGCTKDLSTRSMDGFAKASPATTERWADLWPALTKTLRALEFAREELGVTLRRTPLEIYLWCQTSLHESCATDVGAFAYDHKPKDQNGAEIDGPLVPYIAFTPDESDKQSDVADDDTVYHEVGHVVLAELFAGFDKMLVGGRTVHGGYANASSNDSWAEGFASWFAVEIRLADGRDSAYYQFGTATNGPPVDVEQNLKAWGREGQDEEWAVVALLTDLTDGSGESGKEVPSTLTRETGVFDVAFVEGTASDAVPGRDGVVVDLYDQAGTLLGTEDCLLMRQGRFLCAPTIEFATAKTRVRGGGGSGSPDDDGFDLEPREVIELINGVPDIGDRGGRSFAATTVFDVAELYGVLSAGLPAERDKDADGTDDLDALFIAHGFHEDLTDRYRHTRGERLGLTTHPPGTASTPRYSVSIPADTLVHFAAPKGAVMAVFSSGGRPYAVAPDADGRIPVNVPSIETEGRAIVVTYAKGFRPHTTVIEATSFWPEAAKHDGPFLKVVADMKPAASESAAPTSASPSAEPTQPAGAASATNSGGPGAAMGLAAGAIVLALVAGAVVWLRRRSARPAIPAK